jgi:CheY-like chemotaxis protein
LTVQITFIEKEKSFQSLDHFELRHVVREGFFLRSFSGGALGGSQQRPVVLVVEDESLIRTCALEMVEAAGFDAVAAADADEAIRILESRNDIRAVFTDIQMPGSMDGLRLARVVRNRWPPVALIVTSGHIGETAPNLPSGGRFLSKPYEPSQVQMALRELIA